MAFGIDDILAVGLKIIDKFIPDPAEKLKATQELQRMGHEELLAFLEFDKQALTGQLETNKAEAGSSSVFVAGWRPFVGWVCGGAFAYSFVVQPFFVFAMLAIGKPVAPPTLDMASLMTVLMGMLGLGGMRSVEKIKGVAR